MAGRTLQSIAPAPSAQMRPLGRLIGTWLTQGITLNAAGDADGLFSFFDRYEWLPGGHFIAHTVTGQLGGTLLQGFEVIGYEGRVLRATSYDSLGTVTHYKAALKGRDWSMTGEKERFTGRFHPKGDRLEGTWERRGARGVWRPIMHVALARIGL